MNIGMFLWTCVSCKLLYYAKWELRIPRMALSRANNGKCAGWQVCGELIHVALVLE
jgi:hypothetical protein